MTLLILIGLTGTGKTTTVDALRDAGLDFSLLPNRRELTDQYIIQYLQEQEDVPLKPVTDRTERFTYTRRYREIHPGGMAEALERWSMANPSTSSGQVGQLSIVNDELRIFDGLRGENEVTYAAQNLTDVWFLFLDAPAFVRVERLLGRNDAFDQVEVVGGDGETAVSLDPSLTSWLTPQQLAQLEDDIRKSALTIEDVVAKLTIVQKERQNYNSDATLAALRQHAPNHLIYADTVAYSPEEIAQQVLNALRQEDD